MPLVARRRFLFEKDKLMKLIPVPCIHAGHIVTPSLTLRRMFMPPQAAKP